MAFELQRRKHIGRDLVRTARRQLRATVRELGPGEGGSFEDAVHESRKRLKKVRAVVALLQDAGAKVPRKDRKRTKAAARALSRIRDSAAIIETFDRLRHRYPAQLSEHTYATLRRGLVGARNRTQADAERDGVVVKAAKRLEATRKSMKEWPCHAVDLAELLAVIAGSYSRSRKAMRRARATGHSATLHGWRKEVKTFWYQLRLIEPLTAGVAPLVAELKQLETELGDDHNLVVLEATLRSCPELRSLNPTIRQIGRLAIRMRQQLRRHAFAIGGRLFVRKPKAFARWTQGAVARTRSPHPAAA